ncbi:MAG: hypothetical protein IJM15_05330 [Erysipelotrichaceae bacterium]|nr:hypothetical protein [Erysipelotrichaceae bacterium]
MQAYKYTLNDEDYVEYMAATGATDSKVKVRSATFTFFIPILTACIMFAMGVRKWYWFLIPLALSPLWYFFSQRILGLFFGIKTKEVINKRGERKYFPISLKVEKGTYSATSNGTSVRGKIRDYTIMNHVIVLFPDNGSPILVPSRVFDNDPENLKVFLEELSE